MRFYPVCQPVLRSDSRNPQETPSPAGLVPNREPLTGDPGDTKTSGSSRASASWQNAAPQNRVPPCFRRGPRANG